MQKESGFQTSVIKDFREIGFFVGVGGLAPGYPDLTMIKSSRVILIELKDASGKGKFTKTIDLFQRTQAPFYISFLRPGTERIEIVFKNKVHFYLLTMKTLSDVKLLLDSDIETVFSKCVRFDSVKELVTFIAL